MYKDEKGHRISDNAPYIAEDGTRYPGDFPKDEIPGLVKDGDDPAPESPAEENSLADIVARLEALEAKTAK